MTLIAGIGCKGRELECGEGTVKSGDTCVAKAQDTPTAPPAKAPVAAPPSSIAELSAQSCKELCKELVACKSDPDRPPLLPELCEARCDGTENPEVARLEEVAMVKGADRRSSDRSGLDCSRGCDSGACTKAFDWAAEPPFDLVATPDDPVKLTVRSERGKTWNHTATVTSKVGGIAKVTLATTCANPQVPPRRLPRARAWVHDRKPAKVELLDAIFCQHVFVAIEGAMFDDGSIWRPSFGWTCPGPDGKQVGCPKHSPVAVK